MLRRAVRRPARPECAPRRTRATAPAHSNPSCTGAFFLVFDSFIRQNSHKEKRDPTDRSTLRHSIGPKGTPIPSSTAVLASDRGQSAGHKPATQLAIVDARILASPRSSQPRRRSVQSPGAVLSIAWHVFYHIGQPVNLLWPARMLAIRRLREPDRRSQTQSDFALTSTGNEARRHQNFNSPIAVRLQKKY
jgi:hypothetical protein